MQFSGALLLGRGVTSTIKSGIVDPDAFEDSPEILMYGMFSALLAAGTWLLVATAYELPVSTTHSIFGFASACPPSCCSRLPCCELRFVVRLCGCCGNCGNCPCDLVPSALWAGTQP